MNKIEGFLWDVATAIALFMVCLLIADAFIMVN